METLDEHSDSHPPFDPPSSSLLRPPLPDTLRRGESVRALSGEVRGTISNETNAYNPTGRGSSNPNTLALPDSQARDAEHRQTTQVTQASDQQVTPSAATEALSSASRTTIRQAIFSSATGKFEMYRVTLDTVVWNKYYAYDGVLNVKRVLLNDHRLRNQTHVIFQTDLPYLLETYNSLTLPHIRGIAAAHGIAARNCNLLETTTKILRHTCGTSPWCSFIFYAFKEVRRPRRAEKKRAPSSTSDPLGNPPPDRATSTTNPTDALPGPTETDHLLPLTEAQEAKIIEEWQTEMQLSRFLRRPCAFCSARTDSRQLLILHASGVDLTILRNDHLPVHLLPKTYNIRAYDMAILEPTALENRREKGRMLGCITCFRDIEKGLMPKLALANWLYYGREHLPNDVKRAFADMSVFEKALISRVRTNSLVCRFWEVGIENQTLQERNQRPRRHIRGNIISTPLDVAKVNDVLPPTTDTIKDTMVALVISGAPPTQKTIHAYSPILVRKSRVKLLIEFLLQNNPHYKPNATFRGFNIDNLNALFPGASDEGVPAAVSIGHIKRTSNDDEPVSDYTGRLQGQDGLFMENVSYTLGDHSAASHKQMTLHAMNRCKGGQPFLQSRAGTTPVPDINNPLWLSWAHPNADPYGIGGFYHERRRRPITMEAQLRHLLNVEDPHFEKDPEFAFDVYNIIRKSAVNCSLQFSVPYTAYRKVVDEIARINREDLEHLKEKYEKNPNYEPASEEEKRIVRTMSSISPIARRIPGSVAQKIKMRNEIRSIISARGAPSLFVTLNPADLSNPIVSVLATRCSHDSQLPAVLDLSDDQRQIIALDHPLACAQFFDSMIRSFVKIILRCDKKDGRPGVFGYCNAYYGVVEAQGRGTLHCHLLVWLDGHLSPRDLEDTLKNSPEYRKLLVNWLDSIVSSGFLGTRSHLNGAAANGRGDSDIQSKPAIRPGSMVGPQIAGSDPADFAKEKTEFTDDILTQFHIHDHNSSCWKYLRPRDSRSPENCRFGMDGSTRPETTVDPETSTILLRRQHPRMTTFNPTTTFLMKCNTDVKFIGSGADAKAFMYYVTDYITKAQLSMHAGLSALSYAIRQSDKSHLLDATRTVAETKRAMTIAVNNMLGRQEISHPQAMSYILGSGECYTNMRFQSVNWGEILRYAIRATDRQNQGSTTQETQGQPQDLNSLSLAVSSEDKEINASSYLLSYIFRPSTAEFDSLNLYAFLSLARINKRDSTSQPTETESTHQFSSDLHPQFHTHKVTLSKTPRLPVLLGPRVTRRGRSEAEDEEWGRDISLLFRPWRHPNDLLDGPEPKSWLSAILRVLPTLSPDNQAIIQNLTLLQEAKEAREQRPRENRHRREGIPQTMDNLLDKQLMSLPSLFNDDIFALMSDESDGDRSLGSAFGHLQLLIGTAAAEAYILCQGSLPQMEETPSTALSSHTAIVPPRDDNAIQLQQQFMTECRSRQAPASTITRRSPTTNLPSATPHPPRAQIVTIDQNAPLGKRIVSREEDYITARNVRRVRDLESNKDQLRAFNIICKHAVEGGPQLLMYVAGKGGTGKSYLIDSIIQLFRELGREDEIKVGAPTGIAASLIEGNTLHSLLGIGIQEKKSKESNQKLREEWRKVRYFIVDEVSMVGAQFMATISARLRRAKGDSLVDSDKIFGGMNMIFMGDFFQLAPPKQASLYAHRLVKSPSFSETTKNSGINSIAGAYLWRQVNSVVELKKTKRHERDHILTAILDIIRDNSFFEHDGRVKEIFGKSVVDHIRSRDIEYVASENKEELLLFRDAPVVVGSKSLRDTLNATILEAHANRIGQEVHIYHSRDTFQRKSAGAQAQQTLWNLPSSTTNDNLGQLPLFVGMRVMVTENVAIQHKVVNGSEGIITGFHFSTEGHEKRRFADVVYVRITTRGCDIQAPNAPNGVVPIFPSSTSIKFEAPSDGAVKSFTRRQIPLIPAYAYTDYKSQGRTLERAVIDIASSRGQGVYVMLSRVQRLQDVLVLRWFPASKILQRTSQELREELSRIHTLDEATSDPGDGSEALQTGNDCSDTPEPRSQ